MFNTKNLFHEVLLALLCTSYLKFCPFVNMKTVAWKAIDIIGRT